MCVCMLCESVIVCEHVLDECGRVCKCAHVYEHVCVSVTL